MNVFADDVRSSRDLRRREPALLASRRRSAAADSSLQSAADVRRPVQARGARTRGARLAPHAAPAQAGRHSGRALRERPGARRSPSRSAICATAMTGPSGLHAILDVVLEGQTTVHPSILAEYQQDPDPRHDLAHRPARGAARPADPGDRSSSSLVGEAAGAKDGRRRLARLARAAASRRSRWRSRSTSTWTSPRMEIGDVLRLEDVSAPEGVTFLDDPHETVIVTVAMSRAFAELEEAEAAAAAEAEAEGEEGEEPGEGAAGGGRGRRGLRRFSRRRGVTRAPVSSGRAAPRRSTCSSRVSAIPAASMRGIATTSAGWSSTSSRVGTTARSARSSAGGSRRRGSERRASRCSKPETYMNESGRSISAAARFFKVSPEHVLVVHDDVDLPVGRLQARRGGGLAGHNGLRSICADRSARRSSCGCGSASGGPERGDPRPVADYVLSLLCRRGRRGDDRVARGRRGGERARRRARRSAAALQLTRSRRASRHPRVTGSRLACHVGTRECPWGRLGRDCGVTRAWVVGASWHRRSSVSGSGAGVAFLR